MTSAEQAESGPSATPAVAAHVVAVSFSSLSVPPPRPSTTTTMTTRSISRPKRRMAMRERRKWSKSRMPGWELVVIEACSWVGGISDGGGESVQGERSKRACVRSQKGALRGVAVASLPSS